MKAVLIVDDSRTTRGYHEAILSSGGYRVVAASDGSEALERLFEEPFDLVLTDVNMPGMDGFELIRRIRANAEWAAMPVVILSTDVRDGERKKGYAAGANLYLGKPSSPESLLDHVQMMLGEEL